MVCERNYYYVGRPDSCSFVTLCFFSIDPLKVYLERISATDFDNGLDQEIIFLAESPLYVPWIAPFVNDQPDPDSRAMSLEAFRSKNKKYTEKRFRDIKPLVMRIREIISARDPFAEINLHAKGQKPELNQARTRLHFFSYVCFGFKLDALLPDTWKNGRYSRESKDEEAERLRQGCVNGYEANSAIGKAYTDIYEDTLRSDFGCRARVVDGKDETYQPDGERYPSIDEFMGVIRKHYGQEYLDDRRYGPNRARKRKRQSKGKFTERSLNLMERIEGDAYYVKSIQKGVLADEMPPMCVVRLIDSLTGFRLGIGASLNGEKATAYAVAFFSMGMPKSIFCDYFGIETETYRWPSYGLPLSYVLDRGPGTKADLIEETKEVVPHVELAVRGSGQSKAISESTHPRSTKIDGLPVYELSGMNYIEYFKHEIFETVEANWTSKVEGRLTKTLIEDGIAARPIHLWNHFDSQLRTDAIRVPENDLIRRFLRKRKCRIKRSGAWIENMLCFRSTALFESGLCERISGNRSFEIDAYVIDLCLRHIWIEHRGYLIEAHLVPAIAAEAEDVDWTIHDVRRGVQLRAEIERDAKKQDLAVSLALAEDFEKQTGLKMHQGRQQTRRPKRRKPDALDELAAINQMFGG
jgi:hypothetical protein